MFIQGDLQDLFDALFSIGMIDPALKADWSVAEKEKYKYVSQWQEILKVIQHCELLYPKGFEPSTPLSIKFQKDNENKVNALIESLKDFDQEALLYLAMEVAREYVDYEDRKILH